MQIAFLSVDDVLEIHRRLIETHGGSPVIRDEGPLLSAMAVAEAAFFGQYTRKDICEMAAAYMFHIVMNHPFIDGNKRTGVGAAIVFLGINSVEFTADNEALTEFAFALAEGKRSKQQVVEFIRKHTSAVP